MNMIAELISIGDELLIGQTPNTNATYLSKHLTALGVDVRWVTTLGDRAEDLKSAFAQAMQRSDVVIVTGGLGPTHDDITKNVAAEFFESKLVMHQEIVDRLKRAFEKRGIPWAEVNEEQGLVPEKAEVLNNPVGSAPGLLFKKDEKQFFILPGVPAEMKAICEETLFPMLKGSGKVILQKTVRTTGIAESVLFEKLGDVKKIEENVKVAFLPKFTGVDIRLTVKGENEAESREKIEHGVKIIHERVGGYVYGHDEEELEAAVARLLLAQKKTVAVAESCTGGLLANKLTNISGSSGYFERGIVSYSNEAKMQILGVQQSTLEQHGAVSAETAVEMAEGVRRSSGTDFGVSTTGIAGPTGGTKDKRVGLIYIGVATAGDASAKKFLFTKDRLQNKERFVQAALNLLRRELVT